MEENKPEEDIVVVHVDESNPVDEIDLTKYKEVSFSIILKDGRQSNNHSALIPLDAEDNPEVIKKYCLEEAYNHGDLEIEIEMEK